MVKDIHVPNLRHPQSLCFSDAIGDLNGIELCRGLVALALELVMYGDVANPGCQPACGDHIYPCAVPYWGWRMIGFTTLTWMYCI
mgnify:CR=1 FL=1